MGKFFGSAMVGDFVAAVAVVVVGRVIFVGGKIVVIIFLVVVGRVLVVVGGRCVTGLVVVVSKGN